ncbi:alpha-2-HS-glycoprotein 2 [Myripristis murdjan]|uniref:alpha-2-HS-glycoprotein 2 n=1 Tax=Myripristis murdjan TaxID=586833 RepID=UPI0011760531|nr:alpha-2-HS-glycoprotein-like [Myripristis murdjan]
MNLLCVTVVLGLLAGAWAQVMPAVDRPACDSPEAEAAALVAQDYLNAQHKHGYKYALNRIEDIKIISTPAGDVTYVMEVDLLETDCHVLDPTPVANCTVRPKVLTAVEGDCDVVLKNVGGALTVTAFKCKTEESTEDICLGCPTLLPLNDTNALDLVHASLAHYNNNSINATYMLLEVGRLTSQIVSGGPAYKAEFVIVEGNCTNDACEPLNDIMATHGFCTASSSSATVDCKIFPNMMELVDSNNTVAESPMVHTDSLTFKHGLKHHKLTRFHNPELNTLLSAESLESAEVVPVAPAVSVVAGASPASDPSTSVEAPVVVVKRQAPSPEMMGDPAGPPVAPISLVPLCPGKIRFF